MTASSFPARRRVALILALASLALIGAAPALLRRHAPARSPAQTIVAVGDSITRGDWDTEVSGGWVTRLGGKLRTVYPEATLLLRNAGVDGDTTQGVLQRLAHDVLAMRPRLVIVSIGTNDFDDGVSAALFAQRLRMLVTRLQAAPGAPAIILASMLPIAYQSRQRLLAEQAYNDVIHRAATVARVGYLDLFDHWLALGQSNLRALRHDTEHPNPFGYELLASTTAAFLEGGYLDRHGTITAPAIAPSCDVLACGS